MPPAKDIYFFDRHYDRGLDWYLEFFRDAPSTARAIGELSHDYLFSTVAAERIDQHLPEVRLLTCLRDPVDRSFSHYLYLVRSGLTQQPFEQALEQFPELINNSRYATHLEPYLERFGKARVQVLFFDDLKTDARAFAREVFTFLELPYIDSLPYEQRVLPASRPRNYILARLAKAGANLARTFGLADLVGRIKRSPAAKSLYRAYNPGEKPTLAPATREHLRQVFTTEILRIEELTGRDLKHWLTGDKK